MLATAQGTLRDYQRAVKFLPGYLRHTVYIADISAHWIDKSDRFWYRKVSPQRSEFFLVDANEDRVAPAFDHDKLASALSRLTKHVLAQREMEKRRFPLV